MTRWKQFHLICSILAVFTVLFLAVPLSAVAEEDGNGDNSEYVNPFLEENMVLYQEALGLQGYIYPGMALLSGDESDSQGRHYSPLLDGLVLGRSNIINRYTGGHEFSLTSFYNDKDNAYLGLRCMADNLFFRGNLELASYALIEDTPASARTTTTNNHNYGFEAMFGDVLANWEHRDVDREWELSGLNDYSSDRFTLSFGSQFNQGDIDYDLSYRNVDSEQLLIDNQTTLTARVNGNFEISDRTDLNLGYGGVFTQKPNDGPGEGYSRHVMSGALSRRNVLTRGINLAVFGNYQVLGKEQTINTHWDRNRNVGARIFSDWINDAKFELGTSAEYFDIDRLRYEMPQLDALLLQTGLSLNDLDRFMVRNYGHTYDTFLNGKLRFSNGGMLKQNLCYERHFDNKAPDGNVDTGVPGELPLTLYDVWKSSTGINTPLSDQTTLRFSNVFRKWDMRLRDSEGHNNLFTAALTWNPDDSRGFSLYYENLMQDFENLDSAPDSADQHGFGLDIWGASGDAMDYTTGIFVGKGSGNNHGFDTMKIFASLNLGTDDRWKISLEYLDSTNNDFQSLDFDAFKAVLYYRIDL
jgi:hypothetical protein